MLIFLHGPDAYRRERKKREYTGQFAKKYSAIGVAVFDFTEDGAEGKLREFLRNQSIFEPRKLAVLENAFADFTKARAAILKEYKEEKMATLLLSEEKKPADAPAFLLKEPVLAVSFEYLKAAEWKKFAEEEAERLGVSLASDALALLAEAYEGDTWRLITELEKIASLGKTTIQKKDLDGLDIELAPAFWDIFQGLKSANVRERLAALQTLFSMNEPAGKIFNMLAYQFPEKLDVMAHYDIAVKSGKLEYEEVLLDLAIR